ncbi:MAG: DUF4173 domain-containing protein [Ruminiclostridium sp.]|nr:DUF4173 domain-containing protein [Ruminiclostridium sp.]
MPVSPAEVEATMEKSYRAARKEHIILLIGTIFLGILANILFFASELGLSIPVFVAAFYAVLFISSGKKLRFKPNLPWTLTIPVILLSLTYLFYSNMVFQVLDFMAITLLIVVQAILITENNTFSWDTPGFLIDIIYGFFYRVFAFVTKPFKVIASAFPAKTKNSGGSVIGKVLLGLLISVPLLFIVVSLLISADRIFESYMFRITDIFAGINIGEYFSRAIFFTLIFVTSFSFIYSLIERKKPVKSIEGDGSIRLPKVWDPVVAITVMILVNAIYLVFVVIQFAYLFGGGNQVLPDSLTYSGYARRGFFELIVVTIINFGIMLLFIGFTKMDRGAAGKFLRGLYSLLVGNTAVMLVSAYYRMLLYEGAYGFTYLRVFTQAFMIFMLVLFAISLFRIWSDGFSLAKPFIITAVAAFVIVNYINVDCIIARNNIDRYQKTKTIDVDYLSSLSYDALPEIAKLKVTDDEKVAADIAGLIKAKSEKALKNNDWQSFNISRYKAGKLADR